MNDIIFLIINGITVASIYGLIAVAVSITWSALGLLNLSYGFIFSFAGYGAWLAERYLYGEPIFVMFMGIAAGIVGSVMVCLLVFIPVFESCRDNPVVGVSKTARDFSFNIWCTFFPLAA